MGQTRVIVVTMKLNFVLSIVLVAAGVGAFTVPELFLSYYVGEWYQLYANYNVISTFERFGVCVTATYGVVNSDTLSVYNHMRLRFPTGNVSDIRGFAYTTYEPGQLLVELYPSVIPAPYWVIKLGPVKEYDGVKLYSYAVVTDPFLGVLFILVRDIQEFEQLYENEVVGWVYNFGFTDDANRPIKTYHDDTCLYPWSQNKHE